LLSLQFLDLREQSFLKSLDLLGPLRFTGSDRFGETQVCCRSSDQPTEKHVFSAANILLLGAGRLIVSIVCHGICSPPSLS
jgi:hypothetical protein